MSPRPADLRHSSRESLLLRLAIAICASGVVVLIAVTVEAGAFDIWPVIVPMLLGLGAAIAPQGIIPLVLLVYLVTIWTLANENILSPWTLVVAAAVLIIHTAAALVSAIPVAARLPRPVWRSYGLRMLAVYAAVLVVWVAVRLAAGVALPGGTVALLLAVLLVGAGVWLHDRWLRRVTSRG